MVILRFLFLPTPFYAFGISPSLWSYWHISIIPLEATPIHFLLRTYQPPPTDSATVLLRVYYYYCSSVDRCNLPRHLLPNHTTKGMSCMRLSHRYLTLIACHLQLIHYILCHILIATSTALHFKFHPTIHKSPLPRSLPILSPTDLSLQSLPATYPYKASLLHLLTDRSTSSSA